MTETIEEPEPLPEAEAEKTLEQRIEALEQTITGLTQIIKNQQGLIRKLKLEKMQLDHTVKVTNAGWLKQAEVLEHPAITELVTKLNLLADQ